eukprot:jgi/Picre1/31071/NNA_006426.t1
MPQLRLYNRRWYTTTDTQPVLAALMLVLHILLLIATAIIAGILVNARYYCEDNNKLSADLIGVFVLFGLFLINDCVLIFFGLQGGPFQERKRRPVIIALYIENALIVAHLGFTIYGTYLGYGDGFADGCWNTNPCAGISGTELAICLPEQYNLVGQISLRENCTWVTNNYKLVNRCLNAWVDLGIGWLNQAYDPNLKPPIDRNTTANCQRAKLVGPGYNFQFADLSAQIDFVPRVPVAVAYLVDNAMIQLLKYVGYLNQSYPWVTAQNLYTNPRPLSITPWGSCPQLRGCRRALDSDCGEWNLILSLPDGRDEKWLFRSIVLVSWLSIALTVILDIIFFNAYPDYSSSESWMKWLEAISKLFGFRETLMNSMTEEGFTAAEEFGVLLARLFGGIDMDLTDKLIGIYLASEPAALYLDACDGYVKSTVLEEAFTTHGLQKFHMVCETLWEAAKTDKVLEDCGDYVLSKQCCMPFSKPLGLKHRFRKRNFDAIIKLTGIPPEDFLYVSYASTSFGILPYLIMLDRKHRKVILSVRGTVGINDLMTDLLRIMSSAKAILQSLEDNNIFCKLEQQNIDLSEIERQNTMQSQQFTEHLSTLSQDSEVEFSMERAASAVYEATELNDWGIVVTGHSLGAAVASVISMSLIDSYPSLKCFAFNPPGGLISPELSTLARDFVTSIVVGYDAISRLSILGVKNLIDDIVLSLCRCKRPKLKIVWDLILGLRKDPQTAPETYCSIDDIDEEVKATLHKYMTHAQLQQKTWTRRCCALRIPLCF